jgi:hypothetical protein
MLGRVRRCPVGAHAQPHHDLQPAAHRTTSLASPRVARDSMAAVRPLERSSANVWAIVGQRGGRDELTEERAETRQRPVREILER